LNNISYDKVLDALPDGTCIIDSDYQVVFWSKRLEQWSGQGKEHYIGKKLTILFPNLLQPSYKTRIDQVLENGPPAVFSALIHHHLFEFLCPDQSVQAQRVTVSHLRGEDGRSLALFSVQDMSSYIRQISEYQNLVRTYELELKKRRQLEEKNDQLITAVDRAAEAFIIMKVSGEIEYINKAFTDQTGWTQEDATKEASYWACQTYEEEGVAKHVQDMLKSGQTWQGRSHICCQKDSSFTASVSIAPIFNEAGEVTHAVVVQEDISEQLKFEEQYRKTQKQEALATLIGGIAHDFNNLLSGMLGHLYLANREVQEMPKTAERLKKVQTVANDIAKTVQQLMTFARKGQIDRRKFPLDSFIKEFTKFIEYTVPENITLSVDFDAADFPCQGDAELLQESLLNMVQNAVDAVDEKEADSAIRISLSLFDANQPNKWVKQHPILKEGQYAQIIVWDNGVGIDKENIDRIFDPFFTTKELGSGLGLAVAIGNIKKNRGIIEVESSREQGTSFYVWLPLLVDKLEHQEFSTHKRKVENSVILVVDDEVLVRETCAEILTLLGYQVRMAKDGQDAVEYMNQHGDEIDLILMDMVMPRMIGSVAAKHIREKYPNLPIIFATAYDQSISIKATQSFEHSVLISKPFYPDALQETIDGFIAESGEDE